MNSSRAFLTGIPLGLLVALAGYLAAFGVQVGARTEESRWTAQLLGRKAAIARELPGPRLLLVGGSGVLFGLSAETLEAATGLPSVNLGSHAALGLRYVLHYVQGLARRGDTLLLALEYELYNTGDRNLGDWADAVFIDYVVARDPPYLNELPAWQHFEIAMRMPFRRLKRGLKAWRHPPPPNPAPGVYDVRYLNARGDQTGQGTPENPVREGLDSDQPFPALAYGLPDPAAAFPILEEFLAWARAAGIRVLATWPNIAHHPAYDLPPARRTPTMIGRFFKTHKVPVVGSAEEAIRPVAEFYDTRYHLTQSAARERTLRLVEHLLPILGPGHPSEEGRAGFDAETRK